MECFDEKNKKEFNNLLKKLQQQITEKKMIIEGSGSCPPSEIKKRVSSKDSQSYFNNFETPKVTNPESRFYNNTSMSKDNTSGVRPQSLWTGSAKVNQDLYRRGVLKVQNNLNISNSLQRVLKMMTPEQIKEFKNRRDYNIKKFKNTKYISPFGVKEMIVQARKQNATAKKIKNHKDYLKFGGNYRFKNRKTSGKSRKHTLPKWKKRSLASDTSGSQKCKRSVKASKSGARKANKSKISDSGFKNFKDSSSVLR